MEAAKFASSPEASQPRRVVTAPPPTTASISSTPSRSDDLVETLYNHPSVKIIAFTSSQRISFGPSQTSTHHQDRPGTLPASSRLERTIAVGPFRIYHAPGSVAFLSCGSALQPILPKSQCWCIAEDNSRFVLQIRRPQYWRIELPVSEPDDTERTLVLRNVLDKILLFEKTECPFQRSFTVELPEPHTPVKKKAWTPEGKNLISSPFLSHRPAPKSSPSVSPSPTAADKTRRATVSTDDMEPMKINVEFDEIRGRVQRRAEQEEEQRSLKSTPPVVHHVKDNEVRDIKLPKSVISTSDVIPVNHTRLENPSRAEMTLTDHLRDHSPGLLPQDSKPLRGLEPAISTRGTIRNGQPKHSGEKSDDLPSAIESSISTKQIEHVVSMGEARVTNTMVQEAKLQRKAENNVDQATDSKGVEVVGSQGPKAAVEASSGDAVKRDQEAGNAGLSDQETNSSNPTLFDPAGGQELGDEADDEPSSFEGSGRIAPVNLTRKRMSRMLAGRAFTAPPQLTVVTSPPSKSREPVNIVRRPPPVPPRSDETSPVESTDSFHSVQSWHSPITPLPPSPPSSRPITPSIPQFPHPHENIILPRHTLHAARDTSDYTATPNTDKTFIPSSAGATDNTDHTDQTSSSMPCSPTHTDDNEVCPVPVDGAVDESLSTALEERPQVRKRPRTHTMSISRRGLSPLPPAANLFSPPTRRRSAGRLDIVRRLPRQIVHKTVEILLSPPSHLVNLMLKVAAKIAAGEWRGLVFGFGEGGEKIPVQWDYSDGDFSDWSDDEDYAMARYKQNSSDDSIPRITTTSRQSSLEIEESRSWEVD
ncbi:inheritance of peroxisomes protein 1-domain-containing protein [Whalleya microplaca]|nr:inheritance of peroxisomes protein 1-domain-containing protein [Whalleya microplaca]